MDRHQLGAVGEGAFDLQHGHHLGDAGHDVVGGEDGSTLLDQLGHRAPVARALQDLVADQRHGLGVVERAAPRAAAARKLGGGEDGEPLGFRRCQQHRGPP